MLNYAAEFKTVIVYKKDVTLSKQWMYYTSVSDDLMWRGAVWDVAMLDDDVLGDAAPI